MQVQYQNTNQDHEDHYGHGDKILHHHAEFFSHCARISKGTHSTDQNNIVNFSVYNKHRKPNGYINTAIGTQKEGAIPLRSAEKNRPGAAPSHIGTEKYGP